MSERIIPDSAFEVSYVEGYLSNLVVDGVEVDYGYTLNHLPETSGREIEVESCFEIARMTNKQT